MYSLFFNVKLFLSDAPALNNPYSFAFFKTLFDIHYSASTPEFQAETWGVSIIEIWHLKVSSRSKYILIGYS